jgi:hypothetical protein
MLYENARTRKFHDWQSEVWLTEMHVNALSTVVITCSCDLAFKRHEFFSIQCIYVFPKILTLNRDAFAKHHLLSAVHAVGT